MTKATRRATVVVTALCLLALAGPAAAQDTQGSANIETTQYQDWEVRCLQSASPKKCQMNQLINNPNSDKPIMRVLMEYPPQIDTAAMAFILPLGTRLVPGLQISVPDSEPVRIPFQVCLQNGCRANLRVQDTLLANMKQGTSFTVTLVGPRGRKIALPVSLMGFTAANDAIKP